MNFASFRSSRHSISCRVRRPPGRRSGPRSPSWASRSDWPSWRKTAGEIRPRTAEAVLTLTPSRSVRGLPERVAIHKGDGPCVLENLVVELEGDLDLSIAIEGTEVARANPMRVVASAPVRRYWGDLHGQSGETIGMGSAEAYFRYARDAAFIDMVGHQGNDFQITDAFWKKLNRLTAEFDQPGKFVCLPGYEWSGNTGMGGDRNIFYRHEGRPIRRSSHILVEGETSTDAIYTADELFKALEAEDCRVIAHVGGRYADLKYAHDGRVERTVEVHSSWGTFEWLLHDAFEQGFRVGVVCHSDDHKGRPGATRPGASTFGAVGGLTCYFMPELNRDALFEALRTRRHYGTTGPRIFLDLHGNVRAASDGLFRGPELGPRKGICGARGSHGRHYPTGRRTDEDVGRNDRHCAGRAPRCAARHAGRANGATLC